MHKKHFVHSHLAKEVERGKHTRDRDDRKKEEDRKQ